MKYAFNGWIVARALWTFTWWTYDLWHGLYAYLGCRMGCDILIANLYRSQALDNQTYSSPDNTSGVSGGVCGSGGKQAVASSRCQKASFDGNNGLFPDTSY